jgi:hypothetical protein
VNTLKNLLYTVAVLAAYLAGLLPAEAAGMAGFVLATLQYSVIVRTQKQATIETTIGTAPVLEFWSGGLPANCAAAATGTLLGQTALPSDWLAAAASGAVSKTGVWTVTGIAAGTIGYFRIVRAGSPGECDIQGDVTLTAGGGAMTVDNTSIGVGQVVTVNTFTLTAGNA